MKKSSNKGFTLVELIIVIAILAIIMLIAIPNFSGIQQRMKVRADKATAAQIGKAVRVWYTDYTTDKLLKADLNDVDKAFMNGGNLVKYDALEGISKYCATTYKPSSLLDGNSAPEITQMYLVGLTSAEASTGKVCVAISTTAPTVSGTSPNFVTDKNITAAEVVDYDGTAGKQIAYVEK